MKFKKIISVISIIATLCFSGCAFNAQQANLTPKVDVISSSEGKGTVVSVRVTDERPSKSLGHRGTAYGAAAEITSAQDLAAVVQKEVMEGLQKKGFAVVDEQGNAPAKLSIEVRLLEYSTSTGFWTGGVNIRGALKAVATKNGKTYEKMYRTDKEERVVVVPTSGKNEEWINGALSDVLRQLLDDNGLTMFLAREGS